ncbi:hypothetical protein BT93_B1224 [Corymbia citriodora subsp. variegata]|nr:hypothetical protein BT93_B1224 [Corymbia citriodora subsp. variegata]
MNLQEYIRSIFAFEIAWWRKVTYKMRSYQIISPRGEVIKRAK